MRKFIPFLLTLILLTSCAAERPDDVAALVQAMAGAAGDPVAGTLWFHDALDPAPDAHAASAMPDSLIAAAFGEGSAVPAEFDGLEAYAVRLSGFAEPAEYGCFVVARERDAEAVAAMCLRRMDAIARLCGGEAVAVPPLVMGRCVFYAVGDGAEAALDAARAAMGG